MSDHKMILEQRMKDNQNELHRLESDIQTQLGQEERPAEVTELN